MRAMMPFRSTPPPDDAGIVLLAGELEYVESILSELHADLRTGKTAEDDGLRLAWLGFEMGAIRSE